MGTFIESSLLSSYAQHTQREGNVHRSGGTVLAAGAAVPALIGIADLRELLDHVDHVQRAVPVTEAATVAFFTYLNFHHDS